MRFQLTRQHIESAIDLTITSTHAIQALVIQGMVLVFVLALYHDSPEKFARILLVSMIISIAYLLMKYLLARNRFIKLFTTMPEFTGPIDVEVVDGELVVKTEKSTAAMPRAWIEKVMANAQVTVLCRMSAPCFIIPAEVVAADEDIRAYLEAKPSPVPASTQAR